MSSEESSDKIQSSAASPEQVARMQWVLQEQDHILGTSSLKEEKQVTSDGGFLQNVYFIPIKDEVDEEICFEHVDVKPVKEEMDKKIRCQEYIDERDVTPVGKQEGFVVKESSACLGRIALTAVKDEIKGEFSTQNNVDVDTAQSPEVKEKKLYVCDVCSVTFTGNSALRKHSVIHNGKPSTGEEFESSHVSPVPVPEKLEKNKSKPQSVVHSKKQHHVCTVCRKSFTHMDTLNQHTCVHVGHKPHKCNVCQKSFTRLGELKRHARVHTGERPYECKGCDKRFRELGSLKIHALMHSGERPYACNLCAKTFTHLRALNQHALVHAELRPHICKVCTKSFARLGDLKLHSVTHTGERPHMCQTCSKRFSRLAHLKIHLLTHTKERPHMCQVCRKSFTQLCHLKKHTRIHVGCHECRSCSRRFKQLADFMSHSLMHIEERRKICKVCSRPFARLDDFIRHSLSHTKVSSGMYRI